MTHTFGFTITYDTLHESGKTTFLEVSATSLTQAKKKVREKFNADLRRPYSTIKKVEHVGGTVDIFITPVPPRDPYEGLTLDQRITLRGGESKSRGDYRVAARFISVENSPKVTLEGLGRQLHSFITAHPRRILARMQPDQTVEFWSVYPNGNVYKGDHKICNSSYPLEDLVQMKVTKVDGKIVAKEFI
jgi:hypothetical protein